MAQGFIKDDRHAAGKVQAAGVGIQHGDGAGVFWVLGEQTFAETFALASEEQIIPILEGGFIAGVFGFSAEHIKRSSRQSRHKTFPGFVGDIIQQIPVIHPGPLQMFFVQAETQRAHEMKACAGGGTKTGDVAGVGGDFGFDQNNI